MMNPRHHEWYELYAEGVVLIKVSIDLMPLTEIINRKPSFAKCDA